MVAVDENLERLHAALETARKAYTDGVPTKNRDELRVLADAVVEASRAISRYIAEGADNCPDGTRPMGLLQPQQGKIPYAYEIGCPTCPSAEGVDFRVYGATREEAVSRFNAHKWTPSRPKPVSPPETTPAV